MSHYKPYPAYKDSGVEWLGMVPEHWGVKKLKWLASLQSGDFITSESIEVEGEYPVFGGNGIRGYATDFTHAGRYALIGRQGALCGNINYSYGKFWASEHAVVVSPSEPVNTTWIGEMLRAMNLNQYSVSSAQPGLAVERVTDLYVTIPSKIEQYEIAIFIELEARRIDLLVTKKNRFIDLLCEKRQTLITHAVTKGLNSDVKMKDSGVEWLGEVPHSWSVTPLKYIGSAIIGLTYSPEDVVDEGEGTLVLRSSNIQNGRITLVDNVYVKGDIPNRLITRLGDILICSRNGSRSLIGKNGIIDAMSEGLSFGVFTTVFRTKHHKFLYYVLNSYLFKFQAGRFLTTTINQLTTETLNSFEIPLPSCDEQDTITAHLDRETTRLDTLISKTERSISLLKERRSALITAAVTGQIDVRERIARQEQLAA